MKWFLVLTVLLVTIHLVHPKTLDKVQRPKKASSQKPTKSPKSVLDQFKQLPKEDIDFIRKLDEQFQEHGSDIQIKVVNENATASATGKKNSKRTIDGELGYGYHGQQQDNGYYFSEPKFQIYPYSQHDIPPSPQYQQQHHQYQQQQQQLQYQPAAYSQQYHNNQHYVQPQQHTSVEITPSQSYEIKPSGNGYQTYGPNQELLFNQQQQQQQHQHQYQHPQPTAYQQETHEGPVIVLRIPGPHKYAAHLQALLQQYLEVRAAQYIRAIQEQEQYGHQQVEAYQPQAHQQQQQQYEQYEQPQYEAPAQHYHQQSHPQEATAYDHQEEQKSQQHQESPQEEQPEEPEQIDYDERSVYQHQIPDDYSYVQHQEPQEHQQQSAELHTTENFPSDSHTQAYYPSRPGQPQKHQPQVEETTPDNLSSYRYTKQPYHPPQIQQHESQEEVDYYPEEVQTPSHSQSKLYGVPAEEVSPRTPKHSTDAPPNYHAHPELLSAQGRGYKRQVPYSAEQFQKINKLVNRIKKSSWSGPAHST